MVIEKIDPVLDDGPVYISLDIDGLDSAFLPDADISEVSPCFDPTGITCITVANLMFEMLYVIAHSVAARRSV